MKKNKILLIVLLMVIGFAAVSTTLVLNGTLNIGFNNPEFDVYFSNAIENGVENKKLIKDDTHIEFTKDMTLKDETYTLDYDVTNGSKNYDASLTINCTESNEYIEVINVFDTSTNLPATETRSGVLTIKVIKPYVGDYEEPTKNIEITCTITGTPVERDTLGTGTPADKLDQVCEPKTIEKGKWKHTDNDCSDSLTKGDLITIDTESFYVYNIERDKVSAISEFTVAVKSTGLQSKNLEKVAYDSKLPPSNIYETSEIKSYVEAYANKMHELDTNITTDNVRLITKEELDKSGCNSDNNTCLSAPSYLWSTSYWTMTPGYKDDQSALYVELDGLCSWNFVILDEYGVRPVIELSKSLFE